MSKAIATVNNNNLENVVTIRTTTYNQLAQINRGLISCIVAAKRLDNTKMLTVFTDLYETFSTDFIDDVLENE